MKGVAWLLDYNSRPFNGMNACLLVRMAALNWWKNNKTGKFRYFFFFFSFFFKLFSIPIFLLSSNLSISFKVFLFDLLVKVNILCFKKHILLESPYLLDPKRSMFLISPPPTTCLHGLRKNVLVSTKTLGHASHCLSVVYNCGSHYNSRKI